MITGTVFLTGCGGSSSAAGEMETLRVGMLGKDMKTVCVIMAKELGLFEEEGVDVQFEKVSNLAEGITAVSEANWMFSLMGRSPRLASHLRERMCACSAARSQRAVSV